VNCYGLLSYFSEFGTGTQKYPIAYSGSTKAFDFSQVLCTRVFAGGFFFLLFSFLVFHGKVRLSEQSERNGHRAVALAVQLSVNLRFSVIPRRNLGGKGRSPSASVTGVTEQREES